MHREAESEQEHNELNEEDPTRRFLSGLARAFAGALIFSLPLLMTMEMWSFGFSIDRLKLAIFLLLSIPLLVRLSYHAGFEETFSWKDDVVDAFVAYAVAFVTAALIMPLLGVIDASMSADTIIGMIALQAFPGSIGALLAQSQFGQRHAAEAGPETDYFGELFIMLVGALFLALNLAPTEEIILIAYKQTRVQTIIVLLISLAIIHAFVYVVEFRGQHERPEYVSIVSIFLRFTIVGYALALLMSLYVLWIFGRTDGQSLEQVLRASIVLAFPASVGAAAARLIL